MHSVSLFYRWHNYGSTLTKYSNLNNFQISLFNFKLNWIDDYLNWHLEFLNVHTGLHLGCVPSCCASFTSIITVLLKMKPENVTCNLVGSRGQYIFCSNLLGRIIKMVAKNGKFITVKYVGAVYTKKMSVQRWAITGRNLSSGHACIRKLYSVTINLYRCAIFWNCRLSTVSIQQKWIISVPINSDDLASAIGPIVHMVISMESNAC